MPGDKADQQPQGGDHIPTTNEPQDEEEQAQPGLLSKIGDPVGMRLPSPSLLLPLLLTFLPPQATSSAPPSAPSAHPSRKASQAPSATHSAAPHDPRWVP